MKKILVLIFIVSVFPTLLATSNKIHNREECDVVAFYKEVDVKYGTKAIVRMEMLWI